MSELLDNSAHRINTLKRIVLHLHEGHDPEAVRGELATLVGETDATEVAAMEQQLMADGLSVEQVTSMCDLHARVLRDSLRPSARQAVAPGHPVDTFRRENAAILEAAASARALVSALGTAGAPPRHVAVAAVNALFDIGRHYERKELLLFPMLERHGITGPSKVMWAKDDEARGLVRDLAEALSVAEASPDELGIVAATVGAQAFASIEEMVFKEERILLPMALDTLTEDEWGELWLESPRVGWCLVDPAEGYTPPAAVGPRNPLHAPGREMVLPTGHLTIEQLRCLLQVLPVDLTFVDAEDRVAFFSEGPTRVFARSKAIIGRKVQHCHPPKSVDVVERILGDFRAGRQDVAEFWIAMRERFVHIRYFAVRDEARQYLGCLEVTQDATAIRALEGERRLLQYD